MFTVAPQLGSGTIARLISLAIGSAFASALLMTALWLATMALPQPFSVALLAWFFIAHGWFIAFIADQGLRLRLDPDAASLSGSMATALRAAVPLALPLAAAAAIVWRTDDLRWSLLGWAVHVVTALPTRIMCWLRNERARFAPARTQIVPAILALALIELPGWPIQTCAGECWGLMEGGIVAVPLLGLYLFLASLSAAWLSVNAVRTVARR